MRLVLLILAALPLAAATEVSGKWTINGDVSGHPIPLNCTLKQDATAKISGKCSADGTQIDLAGEVKDQKITFSFTTGGYTLNYTGKVEGDSMTGDIEVAGATGTFSGKRDAN